MSPRSSIREEMGTVFASGVTTGALSSRSKGRKRLCLDQWVEAKYSLVKRELMDSFKERKRSIYAANKR